MFAMGPAFFHQAGGGYATLAITGTFAAATVGTAYSSSIPISGGLEPYSLTGGTGIASGSLDSGFALSITGTMGARFLTLTCASPTTADTMTFTASVGSTDSQTATSPQSIVVSGSAFWYDALFAGGEIGMVVDFNDLSTLFQDTSHTVPCTAAGDPIMSAKDKRTGAFGVVNSGTGTLRFDSGKSLYYCEGSSTFNLQWHGTVPSAFGTNISTTMVTSCSFATASQSSGGYIGPAYPSNPSGYDGLCIAQLLDPSMTLEFLQFGAGNSTVHGTLTPVNGDLVVIATKASSGSSWSFSIYVSGTLFMANSGLPGATITDLTLDIGRGLSARKYYSTVFLNRAITPTEIAAVSAAALA